MAMTPTSLPVSPSETPALIPRYSSDTASPNSSPLRRLRLAFSKLPILLSRARLSFSRPIPSAQVNKTEADACVEDTVKGRSFIVCIAPASALKGEAYGKLCSRICETLNTRIAENWKPNRPWTAPEPYCREAGVERLENRVLVLNYWCSKNDLSRVKDRIMRIERAFRTRDGGRLFNLNPGVALPEGVLVASHKPKQDFREPLGKKVWGQWVLLRANGQLKLSPHTFDEYTDAERLDRFRRLCVFNARKSIQNGSAMSLMKTNHNEL
jgi:hypothetical protein